MDLESFGDKDDKYNNKIIEYQNTNEKKLVTKYFTVDKQIIEPTGSWTATTPWILFP